MLEKMITFKSDGEHPLKRSSTGRHIFGGAPHHNGITPIGSSVPTHRLFQIDLTDPVLPFSSPSLKSLPLYFPLKYGFGGPSMQYRVPSSDQIEIIFISDPQADSEENAYVKGDQFPEANFKLLPALPPGGAKALPFDVATIGGHVEYGGDEPCRNPACSCFGSSSQCRLLASIPPVPIKGDGNMWWEYEGACMFFHYWLCGACETIITANRST